MPRLPGDRAAAKAEMLDLGRKIMETAKYFTADGMPDWDASERYEAFDIIRGPDGKLYAATYETRRGPPPGDGWTTWPPADHAAPPR